MLQYMQSVPVNTCYAYFDLKNAEIYILDGYGTTNGGPNGYKVNNAGTNEEQTLTFSGTMASGGYKLGFRGQVTATISTYTAAAAQAALEALTTIGAGNVAVTGTTATGPFTVEFQGDLAGINHPLLTSSAITLMTSAPAAITITHAESVAGVPAYAAGASTTVVDSGAGAVIAVGDVVTFTNDDPNQQDATEYTVTAKVDSTFTTSITFTPVLALAVQDNAVVGVLPHTLKVKLGDGSFSYTEKKAREYKKNRGKLDSVRNGDEDPLEVKLDFGWIYIKSSTGEDLTVEDVLKQQGQASTWVTAGVDPCEPYCVTMRIHYSPPCTNAKDEVIDLAEFRYEELQHDTKTAMIACTGKCNLTQPTVTRVAKS
jgi:hypothetical protein